MVATTTVLKDAKIALRGADLSGISNQVALNLGVNTENSNAFGSDFEIFSPTLLTVGGSISGFYGPDTGDAEFFSQLGLSGVLAAIAQASTLGSRAYIFKGTFSSNENSASHGEILKYSMDFSGAEGPIGGTLMEASTFSSVGAGTGRQLGAVGAAQTLHAQLHVTSVTGGTPSLSAKIESDAAANFATPTDRIIFDVTTVAGAQRKSVVGAITDDWFRLNITAITGTFDLVLVLAIQ